MAEAQTPAIVFTANAWTLLLLSSLTIMSGTVIVPAMPGMTQAFSDVADIELLVKLVLTLPALCIALCAPIIGWLLDYSSKKQVLVIAVFSYGVFGTAGYAASDSIELLLLSRCLLGIAVAGVMVSGMTLAGAYFPGAAYAKYAGKQAAFSSLGGVIFMAVGGVVAEFDWRSTFLVYVLALVLLPLALLFIEEPALIEEPPPTKSPREKKGKGVLNLPPESIKPVLICYMLAFIEIIVLYTIPVHYPFFAASLGESGGISTGLAMATMLSVIALTSFGYSKIQRGSFFLTLSLGTTALGVGFILLGFSYNYVQSVAGLMMVGIGFGIMRPNTMTWLMSVVSGSSRGRIMGGMTTCIFIGQFISPLVSEGMFQSLGYGVAYRYVGTAIIVLSILVTLCYYVMHRYPRQYSKLCGTGSGCKN